MTVVCGDSHTSTHGAFGALAFGVGTSEVEHVLATQTLSQFRSKTMRVHFEGSLHRYVSAKDMALTVIAKIGTSGGTGYAIEYTGNAIRHLSMEGRMTLCNMAIECGARVGLIAPDETTFTYLRDKPHAPKGSQWEEALNYWKTLTSDDDARYDHEISIHTETIVPQVTWGTSPGQVLEIDGKIPSPSDFLNSGDRDNCQRALNYMGLVGGTPIAYVPIDVVFIGSCTNGRIEDLRSAAQVIQGKKVHETVTAIVVPGSGIVKRQAEKEQLDRIFVEAGFEWREPGCSMCLAINDDVLAPQKRCASTSNRNFEGRQGKGGRTHLVSPVMAAAAAIHGHFVDVR